MAGSRSLAAAARHQLCSSTGAEVLGRAEALASANPDGWVYVHVEDIGYKKEMSDGEKSESIHRSRGTYSLPEELARHTPREWFAPDELRGACREAGEDLGREDAKEARFRSAAQMVGMWRGLVLPAWEAPYVLRDARLGYLNGYESALISGDMSEQQINHAAESRWGERWRDRLRAARERSG